jgi:hypothetical protein
MMDGLRMIAVAIQEVIDGVAVGLHLCTASDHLLHGGPGVQYYLGWPTCEGVGSSSSLTAPIHAPSMQRTTFRNRFKMPFNRETISENLQGPATGQFFGVIDHDLDPQDVFAFGIELDGELAKVKLEHCQITHRFLDHDLAARGLLATASRRTPLASKDGLQGLDFQGEACALHNTPKDLLHFTAP